MVMEMSKTYQYRKVMKPLLERKRRARINKCLDDLKDLMVECLQQEGEHVTRLEKADILELTVEHMRKLKQTGGLLLQPKQHATAHVESFRSGYVHAADQITQVLFQQRQTDKVGDKIMKFLSTRLIELQHQLLCSSSATGATSPAPVDPLINTNVNLVLQNTISPAISTLAFLNSSVLNVKESSSSTTSTSIVSASKDIDLIDVTTVEQAASDTSSTSCEFVWRPW